MCVGEGDEPEKEMLAAADADVDGSSSDGNDGVQDESQYRITVPLSVKLAHPPPLFATPALPSALTSVHPALPVSAALPAAVTHPVVRPLLTVDARPPVAALMTLPQPAHFHQQLMPVPLVRQPRCRDYDGEYV